MICKVCKTNNEEGSKYCISCGSPLLQATKTCPNGHIYSASLTSCPYCPSPSLKSKLGIQNPDIDITSTLGAGSLKTKVIGSEGKGGKTIILSKDSESGKPSNSPVRKIVGWLISFSWRKEGEDYRIFEGRNLISSSKDADIVINDPAVSSPHCMILFRNGKLIVKDELSTNGTYVNNSLIDECELKDSDLIRIGSTELKVRTVY